MMLFEDLNISRKFVLDPCPYFRDGLVASFLRFFISKQFTVPFSQ